MRRLSAVVFALILVLPLLRPLPAASADASFKVIVHPEIQGEDLPRVILSAIFLRRAPQWEDGVTVQPVDQSMSSPVRVGFTEAVLGMPISKVQNFWNDEIKKGIKPPPVKSSDQDVIAYVASTRGAIGYVSAGAAVPDTVKTMQIVD